MNEHGEYGLLVNQNQKAQGKTVLSPIGGALQVRRADGNEIMKSLRLVPADFEKPPTRVVELRFQLDDSLLDEAREVYSKLDTSPAREIYEELVDEAKIVGKHEINDYKLRRIRCCEEQRPSHRSGAIGQMTFRLATIYDFFPGKRLKPTLDKAAQATPALLHYVSRQEIERGRTKDGIAIAQLSLLLLDPKV